MGTEVLRPQNCLIQRIRAPPASFSRRRTNYTNCGANFNPGRVHRKPVARPEQRKRVDNRRPSSDDSKVARGSGMAMEKVTILRRGESLDSRIMTLKKEGDDLVQRIGPDPEMLTKQIRIMDAKLAQLGIDMYAGSAFSMSPCPSSLPLPSFWKKVASPVAVDDSATRDLRRLLGLE